MLCSVNHYETNRAAINTYFEQITSLHECLKICLWVFLKLLEIRLLWGFLFEILKVGEVDQVGQFGQLFTYLYLQSTCILQIILTTLFGQVFKIPKIKF